MIALPRIGRLVVNVVLAIDLLVLAGGVYLATWPMKSIEVKGKDKILNEGKKVYPGDALVYQISYCKYTNKQAAVTRSLIGAVTYPLLPSTNNIPPGCRTAISRNTIIPLGVEPGTYRLQLTVSYQLNPLRTSTVSHESEPFEVVARPGAGSTQSEDATVSVSATTDTSVVSVAPLSTRLTIRPAATASSPPVYVAASPAPDPAPAAASPTPTPQAAATSQVGPVRSIINVVTGLLQ